LTIDLDDFDFATVLGETLALSTQNQREHRQKKEVIRVAVLILNATYEPLGVISTRRAVTLLLNGRA